ncbi:hypothetical protein [Tortoise microvirus 18]|nr:hypothetical protein [Tortoise microvirus 18]
MKKSRNIKPTRLIKVNNSYEAESIEQQLRRVMEGETVDLKTKEKIYTEKRLGVLPETDIRTDRFKIAQDAIDYVNRSGAAKSEELEKRSQETMKEAAERAEKNVEKSTNSADA